jgi:hypothetical protein
VIKSQSKIFIQRKERLDAEVNFLNGDETNIYKSRAEEETTKKVFDSY